VLAAHIFNSSYSGSRDQEDLGLKLAVANSSARPYLEKTLHKKKKKRAGEVTQRVGPEFKPQNHWKKKKGLAEWFK
jgi:hypothetical protein